MRDESSAETAAIMHASSDNASAAIVLLYALPDGAGGLVVYGEAQVPQALCRGLSIECVQPDAAAAPVRTTVLDQALEVGGSEGLVPVPFSLLVPEGVRSFSIRVHDAGGACIHEHCVDAATFEELARQSSERYASAQSDAAYAQWFCQQRATQQALDVQRVGAAGAAVRFAVVIDADGAQESDVLRALDSVAGQTYGHCSAVVCGFVPQNASLAGAGLRQAASRAEGLKAACEVADYVCLLDACCRLEPDALYEIARINQERGGFDVLYGDHDREVRGALAQPYFKGDFSADLLREYNYFGGFFAVASDVLVSVDACPEHLAAAWLYDTALKACERAERIAHIPRILFHDANPGEEDRTYAWVVARRQAELQAIADHAERTGLEMRFEECASGGARRAAYGVCEPQPRVSIVIPTKDQASMLAACVASILEKTAYDNYEILLVENNSTEEATFAYYDKIEAESGGTVRVVRYEGEFNFSKIVNFGAAHAQGDYLLLLNNDMEVIAPSWLGNMVGICQRSGVGAVGARLLYRDMRIQHAGIVVGGFCAHHCFLWYPSANPCYHELADCTRDVSAVTGACLLTPKSVFEQVGGFCEELAVAYNDVDYCLKLRDRGLSVVYCPRTELFHYESASRGYEGGSEKRKRHFREAALLQERWPRYYVEGDPFHNVNLDSSETGIGYYRLAR